MNTNTGHLIDMEGWTGLTQAKAMGMGYRPVPPGLHEEAMTRLAGRSGTYVPKSDRSPLGKWAAEDRKRRKAARKAQRAARKRNRR